MNLTPLEYITALKEKIKYVDSKKEEEFQSLKLIVETIRIQTFYLMNNERPRKYQIGANKIKKMIPFSWDGEKKEGKKQSINEMKNIAKYVGKLYGNRKNKTEAWKQVKEYRKNKQNVRV